MAWERVPLSASSAFFPRCPCLCVRAGLCENLSHFAQFCGTAHPPGPSSRPLPSEKHWLSGGPLLSAQLASRPGLRFAGSGTVADARSEASCRAKGRALSALHSEPQFLGSWAPGRSESVELPFTRQGNVSFHRLSPPFTALSLAVEHCAPWAPPQRTPDGPALVWSLSSWLIRTLSVPGRREGGTVHRGFRVQSDFTHRTHGRGIIVMMKVSRWQPQSVTAQAQSSLVSVGPAVAALADAHDKVPARRLLPSHLALTPCALRPSFLSP